MESILRLGTPTSRFAEKFGAICEVQGINKRILELQKQIEFLEGILKHRDFLQRLRYTEDTVLPAFDLVAELLRAMQEQNRDFRAASALANTAERSVLAARAERMRAEQALNVQQRNMQSIGYRIGRKLSSATARAGEARLRELVAKMEMCEMEHCFAVSQFENAKRTADEKRALAATTDRQIDQTIKEIKTYLYEIRDFQAIGNELNRMKALDCRARVLELATTGRKVRVKGAEKYAAYSEQSDEDIQRRICEIEEEKAILAMQSTESRMEKAKVVFATVDTFLFRIQPRDAKEHALFDHVFLDEAGYCSLIKGVILLGYHCPVTMLGDHMQLPPVCEMDDAQLDEPNHQGIFLFAQSALYVEEAMTAENEPQLLCQYLKRDAPVFQVLHRSSLCETYRFGNGLADVLERYVYKNGFTSADAAMEFVVEVMNAKRIPGNLKRQNPAEAEAIGERIPYLSTDDYAILTPYRNQVRLLGEMLPDEQKAQCIMTVHAAQGREWDTVFLSVVDTTDMYFTNSRRPEIGGLQIINTAVSRAKHRLIIVCDAQFWLSKREQLLSELVHLAE